MQKMRKTHQHSGTKWAVARERPRVPRGCRRWHHPHAAKKKKTTVY